MNCCKICGNTAENKLHVAREMMFGLREKFTYLECSKCGCLQLMEVPPDLSKYYPTGYYSLRQNSWLKVFLRHQWASYGFYGLNPLGWLISNRFHPYHEIQAIRRAKVRKSARILDVGGGTGQLILDLRYIGFKHVTGADPFIERELTHGDGTTVYKKHLAELDGEFDLIMLHHCFEHMDQPGEIMRHLARLLSPNGFVLLRTPIAGSFAWKHYGVNWMHLDAPRHLYLHTPASVKILAEQAGLTMESVFYEGDESQFWGSEQYLKDIPLLDPRSYGENRSRSIFTRKQLREFRAKALEINRRHEADLACFHLSKKA